MNQDQAKSSQINNDDPDRQATSQADANCRHRVEAAQVMNWRDELA